MCSERATGHTGRHTSLQMMSDAGASPDEMVAVSHHKDRKSLKRYNKGSIPERTSSQFKVQRALTDLTNTSVVAGTFIGEECPASSSEFFGTLGAAAIAAGHDRNVSTDATSAPVQTFSTARSSSGNV